MLALLVLIATPASANAPWTWGLAIGLTQWWVVALGLAIEWPVIRHITRRGWWRSLWATLVVNLVSALIGALALWVPLALPLSYLEHWWGPAGIAIGVLVVVALDAAIEGGVLIAAFRARLGRRGWVALGLVNLVTVSSVFAGWGWEADWNRRIYARDWRQLETVGGKGASVVAGDLNGDAHPDLVVAHPDSGVVVHYGLGKGEFGPPTPAPDSLLDRMWRDEVGVRPLRQIVDPESRWSWPRSDLRAPRLLSESERYFLAGDIDGDGRADAITLDADERTSTLRLGDDRGEFRTAVPIPFREWLLDAECVDFDGHGRRELLLLTSAPGNGKNTLRILSLTGQGMREQGRIRVPGDAQQIVTADLDGDGRRELLLNEPRDGRIAVFARGRNVSFRHRADIRSPVEIARLSSADLNEDHQDDLIIGGYHEVAFRCTKHGGR